MATIVAVRSGNWSDTSHVTGPWPGGSTPTTKPGMGDTVETGNYIVTIDEDVDIGTGTLTKTGTGYFAVTAACTITANGAQTGGTGSSVLTASHSSGTVHLNGTFVAGSSAYGANNAAAGTLNVTTATGGTGSSVCGAVNAAAGTLNVTTATGGAGPNAHGAVNFAAGTVTCGLAVGNNYGPGGTDANLCYGVYGSNAAGQITKVKGIRFGPYGAVPVGGSILLTADATNSAQFRTALNGATKTLVDAGAAADFPAIANVRAGTSYNSGALVGTCAVPAANQVAAGIAVDAATGTAVLTAAAAAAAIWDAARGGHGTAGTFGATGEWTGGSGDSAGVTELLTRVPDATAGEAGGLATVENVAAVRAAIVPSPIVL